MADLELLAVMADADPDAIPVLADAIIESKWGTSMRASFVMGLCFGVPLDPVPPDTIKTSEARTRWHEKREESLKFAATQWDLYAGSARRDWAKAVLAVMLFGAWAPAKKTPMHDSRCPWLPVWRNATFRRREYIASTKRDLEAYRRRVAEAEANYRQLAGATFRTRNG